MSSPLYEDFSGGKIANKKNLTQTDIFRLDDLPSYPVAEAYDKLIKSEALKSVNHLFYDLSDRDNFSLIVLTDNHWGSISSHFTPTIVAQQIAKYVPGIYLGYNGDNRNNAINTEECVSSPLDNALSPVLELKLWYEVFMDKIINEKTMFINSGNHDNGKRTLAFGTDILATFFAGTNYYERYSRFSTLLTVRLKANNKRGYEDVKIYVDHGNALSGGDGTKLNKGFLRAKELGANVAIFGHVHQDMMAEYRIEKMSKSNGGKTYEDDMTVIILPATMDQEAYALDARYDEPPSDLRLITIGTKDNQQLLGSTQRERRSLNKISVFCDYTLIPNKLYQFGMQEAKRLREAYDNKKFSLIDNMNKNLSQFVNDVYK